MFRKNIYNILKKEKWEWSWNGGVPYYLLDILFLEPLKGYLNTIKHLKKYSLITSDYGKKISAYLIKEIDSETRCNLYFQKNIEDYIQNYKNLMEKTYNILSHYKEDFRKNTLTNLNYRELEFLTKLLIENIRLYLISQPEVTFILGDELSKEIKKEENPQNIENKIFEFLQPKKTILNSKKQDFENLIKKIKSKNISKEQIEKIIFDFYWKYRSFFMVDLNGNMEEELKILKESLNKKSFNENKKQMRNLKLEGCGLSIRSKKIINYIGEIGAIRLEAKNVWINLTLLIVNLVQKISKQFNIPVEILEKYSFKEIGDLLKYNKKIKNLKKRENSVFIVSPKKINQYHGENAIKIRRIIKGDLKKINLVKGNVAYHGKVKGTAFIVTIQDKLSDKIKEISKVNDPILIAEQTVPSYLPLIEKSKGIITNEGGILSHAAIVSREYKIPAIIGTKIATQIFKQGDKIILDTEKEMVYKEESFQSEQSCEHYIVPIRISDINFIGGKARNTAILKEINNINISQGLILTTKLFKEIKNNRKISKLMKNLKKDETKIEEIHKEINNYLISEDLIEKLKMFLKDKDKIIVRSSATIEDAKKQSFAGQFMSEVSNLENIEKAIKECFKGAFSLHLLSYIENIEKLDLALLIQEYKEVDKSGVAFSINPTNNYFNEIVIESVKGGCEKLVSGKVTPETIIIQRDNKKFSKSNILSKKEVKRLVEQIKIIESKFKTPLDIEWGIEGKRIWIFQARPITTYN